MSLHQPIPLSKPVPMFLHAAPMADSECDATDAWNERNDPENEEGAIVTAYFDHSHDHGQTQATLCGLGVEEDGLTLFYTAYGALVMLGNMAAWQIEQAQGERI